MGRHAAPPPSSRTVNRPVPGRRTSTATAGFLVAGAGLALAGATVLGLTAEQVARVVTALLGVPFFLILLSRSS